MNVESATAEEHEAMYARYLSHLRWTGDGIRMELTSYVKGGSVSAHWMRDGSSFWYADGAPEDTVIYKVEPDDNSRKPLFDTQRLRRALTPLLGHEPSEKGLPFDEFTFVDDEKTAQFMVEEQHFLLRLDNYELTEAPALAVEAESQPSPRTLKGASLGLEDAVEALSPDGRWFATLNDHDLWLRSTVDGRLVQLTNDGAEDYEWGPRMAPMVAGWWAPDSATLAATKVDSRKMPKIPIVHWLRPNEEIEWVNYFRRGEPVPETELFVIDLRSKEQVSIERGEALGPVIGWLADGSDLLYFRREGDFRDIKFELVAFDPKTRSKRVVFTETHETYSTFPWPLLLEDGKRIIWMSERDGWVHIYLYDMDGRLIRRLTEGAFPVLGIVAVDEPTGWIYFLAHGDQKRPYDTHLYRVNLEGNGFARLTEATGQHDIQLAPSKKFFVDTHSTVDRPPTVELRMADGTRLQTLSKATVVALEELKAPEEFVVKAADGETDLWGVLYKPFDFDPEKKYPVIDVLYGGPYSSAIPTTFTGFGSYFGQAPALAQLGYITFIVNGRGTRERGQEFQNVAFGNMGRNEIPDHVAALEQLAEERSYMDLGRVGVLGHSFGGYIATRAMLSVPDVYHVGVASAALVVPETGAAFEFMSAPEDDPDAYEYSSNLRLAGNLQGKLLLVHGTSDKAAPFSHTMKMVDALVRAGKPYDLVVIPEMGHSMWRDSPYWYEVVRRYFQDHLKP